MSEDIKDFVNKNNWFLGYCYGYQSDKYMYATDNYLYLFDKFLARRFHRRSRPFVLKPV